MDPCVENPTDGECLDEGAALFVSISKRNDPDATGTKARAFKTIGAALAKLTTAKRRIYLYGGTYAEYTVLDATHSRVSVFGGLKCDWSASPTTKPLLGATANPFKIDHASGVAIVDLAVEAKDATSGSSIAMFASSADLTLKRVRLVAGNGAAGAAGVLTPFVLPANLNGIDAALGADARVVACPGGTQSTGGKGGANGFDGEAGMPGPENKGTVALCIAGTNGKMGKSEPHRLPPRAPRAAES